MKTKVQKKLKRCCMLVCYDVIYVYEFESFSLGKVFIHVFRDMQLCLEQAGSGNAGIVLYVMFLVNFVTFCG